MSIVGRSGLILAAVALACIGCSSTKSKLTNCRRDNEQLVAQVTEQQRVIDNLRVQNRAIADRLSESEKLLALIHEQTSGGMAGVITSPGVGSANSPATTAGVSGWKPTETK